MTRAHVVPVVVFLVALGAGLHLARRGTPTAAPASAPVAAALRSPPLPALQLPPRPPSTVDAALPSVARVQDALCRSDDAVISAVTSWIGAPLSAEESFALNAWLSVPPGGPTCVASAACGRWSSAVGDPQGLVARVVSQACGAGGAFASATGTMPAQVPVESAEAWALASRRLAGLPAVPFSLRQGSVEDGASWRREVSLVAPGGSGPVAIAWRGEGLLDGASLAREAASVVGP